MGRKEGKERKEKEKVPKCLLNPKTMSFPYLMSQRGSKILQKSLSTVPWQERPAWASSDPWSFSWGGGWVLTMGHVATKSLPFNYANWTAVSGKQPALTCSGALVHAVPRDGPFPVCSPLDPSQHSPSRPSSSVGASQNSNGRRVAMNCWRQSGKKLVSKFDGRRD